MRERHDAAMEKSCGWTCRLTVQAKRSGRHTHYEAHHVNLGSTWSSKVLSLGRFSGQVMSCKLSETFWAMTGLREVIACRHLQCTRKRGGAPR